MRIDVLAINMEDIFHVDNYMEDLHRSMHHTANTPILCMWLLVVELKNERNKKNRRQPATSQPGIPGPIIHVFEIRDPRDSPVRAPSGSGGQDHRGMPARLQNDPGAAKPKK